MKPCWMPSRNRATLLRMAFGTWLVLSGCTIHFVDAGMDSGPIIAQAAVHVFDDDTPETLHARIQEQEHIWFPKVINMLAAGAVKVKGRRVKIKG